MVSGPTWARRSVEHERLCARRGCGAPAVATLRFQPAQRSAWLVDVDATATNSERDLCTRHATALILPTGWQLFDGRRAPAGDGEILEPPGVGRPALRARRGDLAPVPVEELDPQATADEEDEGEAGTEPEQTQVAGEALIDVLDARTPLLQRAFRNVWPGADSTRDSIDGRASRPGEGTDVRRGEPDEQRDRGEDQ
jgi:uncharacterized protein DUF3499